MKDRLVFPDSKLPETPRPVPPPPKWIIIRDEDGMPVRMEWNG